MLKKVTLVLAIVLVTAGILSAQWTYKGPWPNDLRKGGTHGIEITPDGKIWQTSYYKSTWISGGKKFTNVSPILVFSPDGSTCDSIFTITTGTIIDTLGLGGSTSGSRGLSQDGEGNIYWVASGKMIKIDYKTYKGLARRTTIGTETGSSPAGPAVSKDGIVFLGPVVGGGTNKIVMYDKNLNILGTAVTGPKAIARTMKISPDGNTIYWTPFTGTHGVFIYSRPDEFSPFVLSDSLCKGMSVESAAWDPKTGYFWVSNDKRSETAAPGKYGHLRWYGIDLKTKKFMDSLTLASPITPAAADELPRGMAFSKDGNTIYVGLFGTAFDRLFKFERGGSGIAKLDEIPTGYQLSQNYPNPFNPTTNIQFSIPEEGMVTLKVYNTVGQEVATLVNEFKSTGSYQVDFNAANLSSGVYVYTLRTGKATLSKKMLLIK